MADEDNRFRSYASRVSTKAKENKSSGSSGFKSSSGSQNRNDNARKSNNEKQTDQLVKLHNQGQGNSTQARLIQDQLAASDAKAAQWNYAENRPASFQEKMGALYGYQDNQRDLSDTETGKTTQIPGYLEDFYEKQAQSVYDADQEGDYLKSLYKSPTTKALNLQQYGLESFSDLYKQLAAPGETPTTLYEQIVQSPEFKAMGAQQQYAALQKLEGVVAGGSLSGAGSLYQITDQERADMGLPLDSDTMQSTFSTYVDPQQQAYVGPKGGFLTTQGKYGVPAYKDRVTEENKHLYKGYPIGSLIKSMNPFANTYKSSSNYSARPSYGGSYSMPNYNYGGGGGGWDGYGGGGGSGGGGGYTYDMGSGFPQTYQRGQVGPGGLQEQVNQAYLSGGKGFSRGGIVSLLRL